MIEKVFRKEDIVGDAIQVISEWSGKVPEGGEGYPRFSLNGLATPPAYLDRGWLGLLGQLRVLPGTCAVITGREGFQRVYGPGAHFLFDAPLGPAMIQVVNTSRQQREAPPVTALTKDKWSVTLRAVLDFEVKDAARIAQSASPLETLDAVAVASLIAQIESMPHDALTGLLEEGPSGLDVVAQGILERLQASPELDGLNIIGVCIVEREGDERRIEIVRDAVVERTRLAEESKLQEMRDASLLTKLENERAIAEREQEVEAIRRAEQEWQAQQERAADEWKTAKELETLQMQHQHEEMMEIIRGTTEITTEAAKSGHLEALNVSPRRRPELAIAEGTKAEVVGEGIQVLKALRERIAPPTTYFLPQHSSALAPERYRRLQLEEARLSRIKGAEYEIVTRRGGITSVSVRVAGYHFRIECPDGYPSAAPLVTITGPGDERVPFNYEWDEDSFLSDLVREALIESLREEDIDGSERESSPSDPSASPETRGQEG